MRKQGGDQAKWIEAWTRVTEAPDVGRSERLLDEAATRLTVAGAASRGGEGSAFGWSGGKDSLALDLVCRRAGIRNCVLVVSALEYPAFLRWVDRNAPPGLEIHTREMIDWQWLRDNPDMLFPRHSTTAAKWFRLVQHSGQRSYMKGRSQTHDRPIETLALILGRRTSDGNYCGTVQPDGTRAYRDRGGFMRVSPIWDWSHEDVLHVLASNDVPLPPFYLWSRGFEVGTGPWAARQGTLSVEHGWSEVLTIDPSVVHQAAEFGIPGASAALEGS